ncbi:MAG: DUF5320 domain-containing protein [bacterium]
MPMRDMTGPEGKGPGTGRGLGKCTPGQAKRMIGLMKGIKKGLGRRNRGEGIGGGRGKMDGTGPRRKI